uniref:Uncharacterized protein n=1 Tax=Spongospora subterranea TaxID=70186 RepID=A0A0H5RD78_9EUKA|eukprot:CRZ11943.1 hypothetical protein [Spongospora subterranea]
MGKGGASVGKFVKGMGINESDIEPGDFPTRLIEKDGNTKDTETPSFVEEIKQMMALRKERQLEIESTIEAISPTAVFSRLIEEMKEISRVNYLNEAEQKMRELREQYSRWGEIQNGAVGDLQEMSRVFLIRHNHIDYQISELLRLFQRNTLKCTRELTMVKEKMVKELAQESDQIRLAALKLTEDDKKSIEKLQRRSHEAASIAETEFMQAREIAKDQERLTTLRLTLRSQLGNLHNCVVSC